MHGNNIPGPLRLPIHHSFPLRMSLPPASARSDAAGEPAASSRASARSSVRSKVSKQELPPEVVPAAPPGELKRGWNRLRLSGLASSGDAGRSQSSAKPGSSHFNSLEAADGEEKVDVSASPSRSKTRTQRSTARVDSAGPPLSASLQESSGSTVAPTDGTVKKKRPPAPAAEPPKPKSLLAGLRARLAAARDELVEADNMKDRLFGAVTQLLKKPVDDTAPPARPALDRIEEYAPYVPLTPEQRTQKWYDVWWEASRAPRRRQFAATRIQNVWAL